MKILNCEAVKRGSQLIDGESRLENREEEKFSSPFPMRSLLNVSLPKHRLKQASAFRIVSSPKPVQEIEILYVPNSSIHSTR